MKQPNDPSHPVQDTRSGLVLFAVYLALYAGFMGLNAFRPQLMGWAPFGGVNLAILYGLGLILAAIGLAFLYMYLRRERGDQTLRDTGVHPSGVGRAPGRAERAEEERR